MVASRGAADCFDRSLFCGFMALGHYAGEALLWMSSSMGVWERAVKAGFLPFDIKRGLYGESMEGLSLLLLVGSELGR